MSKQPAKKEQAELDRQHDPTKPIPDDEQKKSKRPRENCTGDQSEQQKADSALNREFEAAYSDIIKEREQIEAPEVVFSASGKEYALPQDLEEYRKENPIGAAVIDKEKRKEKLSKYLNEHPEAAEEIGREFLTFSQLLKDEIIDPANQFFKSDTWKSFINVWEQVTAALPDLAQIVETNAKIMAAIPEAIKGTEYDGLTTEEFFDRIGNAEPEEQKRLEELFDRAKEIAARSEKHRKSVISKQAATEEKEKAKQENAVMEINNLVFFTGTDFDFSNSLYKLGEAKPEDFNQFGCYIGEKEKLTSATEIAPQLKGLISALIGQTVDDYREEFVRTGKITFYVKGVAESLNSDFRNKRNGKGTDQKETDQKGTDRKGTDRKNAMRAFLEAEIKKATGFVCAVPDGSSYSVLNYYGYNPISDTMTIESPYFSELWRLTQEAFFDRLKDRESRVLAHKKYIPKADFTPLEVNTMFTAKAYMENPETLEIAEYILKNMLQSGLGVKDTNPSYQTVINHCPTFKRSLDSIKSGEDGKNKKTRLQRYNRALCKFTSAYKLIKDKEKCTATSVFDNISVKSELPYMTVNGITEKDALTSPTNSTLHKKFTISWTHSRKE